MLWDQQEGQCGWSQENALSILGDEYEKSYIVKGTCELLLKPGIGKQPEVPHVLFLLLLIKFY